ncbi:MAG: right-handed parallel beta-helix repeat-containing protein [Planctomycetota bacterium]
MFSNKYVPALAAALALAAATVALTSDRNDATAAAPMLLSGAPTPIASLPFTAGVPGAYCLTGNLYAAPGSGGIVVTASSVTIDLGGFQLGGANEDFAAINASDNSGLVVKNGTIFNWGGDGIRCGDAATITDVRVLDCDGHGIDAGDRSHVERVDTRDNGSLEILVGKHSLVRQCSVEDLNGRGTAVSVDDCSIVENVRVLGGFPSVGTGDGCRVVNCCSSESFFAGFALGTNSSIEGCNVLGGGGDGIRLLDGCVARDNVCSGLATEGISVNGDNCVVDGNVLNGNGTGLRVTGIHNLIVGNRAVDSTLVDFVIPFPNTYGPILADFAAIGSNTPHANFGTPLL